MISLSATDFFNLYYQDDAEFGIDKFLASKGDQNIVVSEWQEPTAEHKAYLPSALKTKRISIDVIIKGNPFVSKAPTVKTFYMIE